MTDTDRAASPHISDSQMIRTIWPLLGAGALGLVPFTIFSNFTVDIARVAASPAEDIAALRGLGGIAALLVGVGCAPLIDKLSRSTLVALSLAAIAVGCALAALGSPWTWVLFCLVIGAATATLNPAVSAMAADSFDDDLASGRAATMVSASTTLTAILAAPILAAPAYFWGWRGDILATAVLCLVVTGYFMRTRRWKANGSKKSSVGYREGFSHARRIPAVFPLLSVSILRTTVFMGQLAYIAVYYDKTFGLGPGLFSIVWTISGLSFFLGNWFGGKLFALVSRYRTVVLLMIVATILAVFSVAVLFFAPHLSIAIAMTALTAASHAVIAASVTTLLVRQTGEYRGTILALNGAGQSLGVFAGAAIAAAGFYLGEWHGMGIILAGVTLIAALCGVLTLRHYSTGL